MREIHSTWFSGAQGHCAIVVAEDEATGERRAFIGVAGGAHLRQDTADVIQYGQKLGASRLQEILQVLTAKPTPAVSPALLEKHAGKMLTTREALEAFHYSPTTSIRDTVLVSHGILEEMSDGRWRVPSAPPEEKGGQ